MLSTSSGHDQTVSAEGYPSMALSLTIGRQQHKIVCVWQRKPQGSVRISIGAGRRNLKAELIQQNKRVCVNVLGNVPMEERLRLCDDCPLSRSDTCLVV
jgi:hypothetical protein